MDGLKFCEVMEKIGSQEVDLKIEEQSKPESLTPSSQHDEDNVMIWGSISGSGENLVMKMDRMMNSKGNIQFRTITFFLMQQNPQEIIKTVSNCSLSLIWV